MRYLDIEHYYVFKVYRNTNTGNGNIKHRRLHVMLVEHIEIVMHVTVTKTTSINYFLFQVTRRITLFSIT